jgi:hypothetical protein
MTTTDIYINQGSDYNTTIDIENNDGTPINVAGYIFNGTVKKSIYSANATANLIITVNSNANGNLSISMPANVSSNIEAGNFLYTVEMKNTSNITTCILQGLLSIMPSATVNQLNNYPKFYLSNTGPYKLPVTTYS